MPAHKYLKRIQRDTIPYDLISNFKKKRLLLGTVYVNRTSWKYTYIIIQEPFNYLSKITIFNL